ncbi:MAG: hypothetical protein ABJP48_09540 [Erythrobacter sp.]
MTSSDHPSPASGEEMLKSKRRSFWRYIALSMVLAMFAGLIGGVLNQLYLHGDVPLFIPLAAIAVVAIGFLWFSFDYFRRVDELDLQDNLWSHMVGFYGGLAFFGVWFFCADLGLADQPTALPVLAVMLVVTFITYLLRKMGLR